MKKVPMIIFLFVPIIFSQSFRQVKFIVLSESVPRNSSVYIVGNHYLLGNWNPSSTFLPEKKRGEWSRTFKLPFYYHLEYKLTLGSWKLEALDREGNTLPNNVLDVINDTTIIITILNWGSSSSQKIVGQITGTTEYHHNLKGKGIKPRDVIVWLPPGYYENKEQSYPVLYMHDGQNIVDPVTSSFGVDWQIDEAADTLIKKNYIKPIIIVGIYNTSDRSSEYSENDTGYAYMDFVMNNLKPFIDSTYRTKPGKESTGTGGSSLAGLISFMLVWYHPDVFSMAACISPALKVGRYDFVSSVENYMGDKKKIRIYMDVGNIGLEDSLEVGVDEMANVLRKLGFTEWEDLYIYKAPNAEHSEKFWAERIWRPLIFMFGNENSKIFLYEK